MTSLADINDTLQEQRPILEGTQTGVMKLEKSFSRFFMGSLDDLETQRESLGRRTATPTSAAAVASTRESAESDGGLFNFGGLGGILSAGAAGLGALLGGKLLFGLVKALLKRGVFATFATALAGPIGDFVKNLSGSDVAGIMTENAIAYGGIGAMLFGKKGAIAGAIFGAINTFSSMLGDKIKEHEIGGEFSYITSEGAQAAINIASGAGIGFLLGGPLGALVGAVGVGALELSEAILNYKTDDKFKGQIDGLIDKVNGAIDSLLGNVAETIDMLFDSAIRTKQERQALQYFNPTLYNQLVENEKQLAAAVSKYNRLNASGAPASQIEAARQEMMDLKSQRSDLETRIASEDAAYDIIRNEGEFGPGAAQPKKIIEQISEVSSGADLRETIKRIAMELGQSESAATQLAAGASMVGSNSAFNNIERAERYLANQLGMQVEEMNKALQTIRSEKSSGNTVVSPVDASTKSTSTVNNFAGSSGSSIDQNRLNNFQSILSGRSNVGKSGLLGN